MRIISLLSSCTETLCALGAGHLLVGRSHECDFPAEITRLPVVSRPLINSDLSSADINSQVLDRKRQLLSLYELDERIIEELKPDLILTQVQCDVCAITQEDVDAALASIGIKGAQVVAVSANSLSEVWRDFVRIGEAVEVDAHPLIQSIKSGLQDLSLQCSRWIRSAPTKRLRVASIEWCEPLMFAGNWVPELFDIVHADLIGAVAGEHSPWATFDELRVADPDVIIFHPCGFKLDRVAGEARALLSRPEWRELRAVQSQRVYAIDGNELVNRPGPRLLETAQAFAEMLYPEALPAKLTPRYWIPIR